MITRSLCYSPLIQFYEPHPEIIYSSIILVYIPVFLNETGEKTQDKHQNRRSEMQQGATIH